MNMAKRKYTKMKKIEPAVQSFMFTTPTVPSGGSDSFYIDLSQCASLMNRRFYRQGINWAVSRIKVLTAVFEGAVQVGKLPNTWVMSNAWEKGFRAWQRMNNEALAESPSVKPKFLDFKIYADAQHHTDGFGANLRPFDLVGTQAVLGEWESSKLVVPFGPASPGNTAEFEFVAVVGSYPGAGSSGLNAVSLIEGYAASRGLPNVVDPNTPGDADDADGSTPENWLSAMFNDGTDQDSEVISNLITEQDRAPYPYEGDSVHVDTQYPGGANNLDALEIHDYEFVTSTTIGGTTRLKGGNFPCGLMKFVLSNSSQTTSNVVIQVDLVPGAHRGYLCEPMTEM